MQGLAVGVFVHECFGHSSEADNYLDYHKALNMALGKRWTTAPLTVHDRPSSQLYGGYAIDDEETPAGDTTLINGGEWCNLLTDRRHRHLSGGRSTGHGRGPKCDISPRSSVLCVDPSRDAPPDLVAELDSGWVLGTTIGGYSAGPYLELDYLWVAPVRGGVADLTKCYGPVTVRARKRALAQRIQTVGSLTEAHSTPYDCVKNGVAVSSSFIVPDLLFDDAIIVPGPSNTGRIRPVSSSAQGSGI